MSSNTQVAAPKTGRLSGVTVLVVDDDDLVCDMISTVLGRAGAAVQVHPSAFGLSATIRQRRPDVVLLDVHMPGLSGIGALTSLRELGPSHGATTPIVLHSGIPLAELEALARQVGVAGVLAKPARPSVILDAVAKAVGR